MPLGPGTTLGSYQVTAKIGEGGMGEVYRARDTKLDRDVALKVLPADRMKDANAVERFEREMRAVGKLDHPNIVRATDAGEADNMHYLVMEHVEGLDLSTLVRRVGPLPAADACEIARQTAIGLQEAHEHNMVHRDIKPSNVMRTPEGAVKLMDFGIAKLMEPDKTTRIAGTPAYMAPEQMVGKGQVSDLTLAWVLAGVVAALSVVIQATPVTAPSSSRAPDAGGRANRRGRAPTPRANRGDPRRHARRRLSVESLFRAP